MTDNMNDILNGGEASQPRDTAENAFISASRETADAFMEAQTPQVDETEAAQNDVPTEESFFDGTQDAPVQDAAPEQPAAPVQDAAPEQPDAPEQPADAPQQDGEYHFSREQQYREQPPADGAQQAQRPVYPYGANRPQGNPYGAGQPGANPYASRQPGTPPYTSQQQRQNPYAQGARPNANPYSASDRQFSRDTNAQGANPYRSGGYPYAGANNRNQYAYTEQPAGQKKSSGGKIVIGVLAALMALVLIAVVSGVVRAGKEGGGSVTKPSSSGSERVGERIENVDEATTASSPVSIPKTVDDAMSSTEIYKAVLPSSVGILVYSNTSKTLSSEGSGVIYAQDRDSKYTYIVTCAHVISGVGQNIVVQLYNEKEYTAQVVGYDSRTDIGVVRIEASGLQTLEIGNSDSLQVGDTIYAIGNPGGTEFANTFTNGIVTALDRPVSSSSTGYTMECIQHNAAINPGNSGGALVNEFGQLIGINSMKIVAADYEGMGFAVPSSVFVDVVNDLVVNGYVANRPKIGISYLKASAEQAYAMFVAIKGLPGGSIIVASISEDSDFYGKLEKGDLITAINGEDLTSAANLAAMIEEMNVGDTITLKVVRIKQDYTYDEFTFTGKLVEDKADAMPQEEETTTSNSFEDFFGSYFGDGSGDSSFDDFFGRNP